MFFGERFERFVSKLDTTFKQNFKHQKTKEKKKLQGQEKNMIHSASILEETLPQSLVLAFTYQQLNEDSFSEVHLALLNIKMYFRL